MTTLHKTGQRFAMSAVFLGLVLGACSSEDTPGTGGNTGGGSGAGTGGGTASGGTASGGTASGGTASGGTASGGTASGGTASGGTASGGTASGGTASGGTASGGTASGGSGGTASGGSGTGGAGTGGGGSKLSCVAPTTNATVGNTCPTSGPPALKLTQVVTGLIFPVYVTQAPGDTERLYVVEQQTGLIRTIKNGAAESTPFLNIKSVLGGPGGANEQGFLGLAFDPNYVTSKRFFIKYSGKGGNGKHVIAEYKVGTNGVGDPNSARVILEFNHISATLGNHNGGMVEVGPDGCLYIAVGDGGDSGDPGNRGQNTSDKFGSILRIDVDRYPMAAPGNMASPADPHVWNYGLRNPWRFSFDRATGDVYIGDVGQNLWEEIDVEPKGRGGRNYGWRVMEGTHCYNPASNCDQSNKVLPAAEYTHTNTNNTSVIGGYVYRGSKIPGMAGRYLYGDLNSRTVWTFTYKGETNGQPELCSAPVEIPALKPTNGSIVSFGQDLAGELYIVTQEPGTVYRIDPAN